MLPIESLSEKEARRLRVLLFDLDDTLLSGGRLEEEAYRALFRLRESGLELVAVTGRPLGWGDVIARQWPILGVVAENGAVACACPEGRLETIDFAGGHRAARAARLGDIVREIRGHFPELQPTDDERLRRSDFTFDIGEHERVTDATVRALSEFARSLGARTIVSSVHLHVTLDGLDKASGTARFLALRLGMDPTEARSLAAFIGDSENDAACFGAFTTTVGVANLRGRPTVAPRFITEKARGVGFAEAATIIALRRQR
jgi:HAD superfamily hydrolase (TIGR01484 family)